MNNHTAGYKNGAAAHRPERHTRKLNSHTGHQQVIGQDWAFFSFSMGAKNICILSSRAYRARPSSTASVVAQYITIEKDSAEKNQAICGVWLQGYNKMTVEKSNKSPLKNISERATFFRNNLSRLKMHTNPVLVLSEATLMLLWGLIHFH